MDEAEIRFVDLVPTAERREDWRRHRQEAIRYVETLNCENALRQLAERLDRGFKKQKRLPTHDELPDLVRELARSLGLAPQELDDRRRQSVVVTRALALFLSQRKPSKRRLAAVASVEFLLDVPLLALSVASGSNSKAWLHMLQGTKLDVTTINNDAYMASDERERWANDLQTPVPTWHVGNFPRMDRSTEVLISAILRELDEASWLAWMDRLPLPMVMESLLWEAQVQNEPARLLAWIRIAPLVFDGGAKRTTSALAFVLERQALTMLQDFARKAMRWDSSLDELREIVARLEPALADLADAVGTRPDGRVFLAELAARLAQMACFQGDESPSSVVLRHLHYQLVEEYLERLGDTGATLEFLRSRSVAVAGRGAWNFWLCGVILLNARRSRGEKVGDLLELSWSWLAELLRNRDLTLVQRYRPPAQWTHQLAGSVLMAQAKPLDALEAIWSELASQRTKQRSSDYENDMWATTRFAVRSGFAACHLAEDQDMAEAIWSACMEMAITMWFTSVSLEPFDEVTFGLAHLAKARFPNKSALLSKTFEYLVGLPDDVARSTVMLTGNGEELAVIHAAAASAGIDLAGYLAASTDSRLEEKVRALLASLNARVS